MFRKMPILMSVLIVVLLIFNEWIPLEFKSVLLALSLSIKSGILFVLPLIVFMLLYKTISKLAANSTKVILMIFAAICCSNFFSTMLSYFAGSFLYTFDLAIGVPFESGGLEPAWVFNLPKWIPNDVAMFLGVLGGIICPLFNRNWAAKMADRSDRCVGVLLSGIKALLPVFIAGFLVKLIHDNVLKTIVYDYAFVFMLIAAMQMLYIAFLYWAFSGFRIQQMIQNVQNMLPAALVGFGSMSSAAAMPLTLAGAEKNSQNSDLFRLVIPSTVNIHLIGDCLAIPIFAFAVLKNFGVEAPTFYAYTLFAFYFVLAKFSVAAIPGGGILVMLPILERYLGFDGAMTSLITALYILFDPVITCANVLGNGAFSLGAARVEKKLIHAELINDI